MRLVWEEINENLVGEKTNVLRDEMEVYADQKPTVISEGGAVSANRRMASSVFGGKLLSRDGTTYMAKTCQVQEEK